MIRIILIPLLVVAVGTTTMAQLTGSLRNEVQQAEEAKDYATAIEVLSQYLDQHDSLVALEMVELAKCYAQQGKRRKALHWLEAAVDNGLVNSQVIYATEEFAPLKTHRRWAGIVAGLEANYQSIAEYFQQLKTTPPHLWVPFSYDYELFGYMHLETEEILIPAQFYYADLIEEEVEITTWDLAKIVVQADGSMSPIMQWKEEIEEGALGPYWGGPIIRRKNYGTDTVCFTMHSRQTELFSYSDRFKSTTHLPNISGPYILNGTAYAIVAQDGRHAIIDQNCRAMKGYDFRHNALEELIYTPGEELVIGYVLPDGTTGVRMVIDGREITAPDGRYIVLKRTSKYDDGRVVFRSQDQKYAIGNYLTEEWLLPFQEHSIHQMYLHPYYQASGEDPVYLYLVNVANEGTMYMREDGTLFRQPPPKE